jgi:hypothetical protein
MNDINIWPWAIAAFALVGVALAGWLFIRAWANRADNAHWWAEQSPFDVFSFLVLLIIIPCALARTFGFFPNDHDDNMPWIAALFCGVLFAIKRVSERKTVRWYRGDNGELVLQQRSTRVASSPCANGYGISRSRNWSGALRVVSLR